MSLRKQGGESGVSALLVALTLFVLVGLAAIAIDLSVGFNERRQDQTAADIGVMAGAVDAPGSSTTIRDQILDFTQRNVIGSYSDWQTKWETCLDTERASLNASGFNFVPVPAPGGWSVATVDCISIDQGGFLRVALPELEFDTSFARVLGFDQLQTNADAIAKIAVRSGGGILPFGILSGATEGQHICLRDSAGGHAQEPCDGPDAGNFGAVESPHYGTQPGGPAQNCNGSPKKDVLAVNIAIGIDHLIWVDDDGAGANEIRDTCGNMDAGKTPDTLNTFTGISSGLAEGLATGPVPGGYTPRLQNTPNPKRFVYGSNLDDKPLWEYIDAGLTLSDVPADCLASTFTPGPATRDYSIPTDGINDAPNSWQHMSYCFDQYLNTTNGGLPWTAELFVDTIKQSPRFAYVPQFWEGTFGSGNSWRHIERFKATWLQATWWKKGGTINVFHPGEPGTFNQGGNWSLIQLSGLVIPDNTLPLELRGDPPPSGGLGPFIAELYR